MNIIKKTKYCVYCNQDFKDFKKHIKLERHTKLTAKQKEHIEKYNQELIHNREVMKPLNRTGFTRGTLKQFIRLYRKTKLASAIRKDKKCKNDPFWLGAKEDLTKEDFGLLKSYVFEG